MRAEPAPKLRLEPLHEDEFAVRRVTLVEEYAQELTVSRRLDLEHARSSTTELIGRLLPQGVATPGMLLLAGVVGDQRVGWIWLALPQAPERPETAWIYNVEVDAEHRGNGYGRALLLAAEAELARRGVPRIGLNVSGHNPVAIRLYESLGYGVTAQQMAKPLPTG